MALNTYSNFLTIARRFAGILLDAYGVFWAGNAVGFFPGSKDVMEQLVKKGKIVGILSNSTQLVQREKEKYSKQGLIEGKHFHFLLTSGEIAQRMFIEGKMPFPTPRKKYALLGEVHPKYTSPHSLFEGSPYTETADFSSADFIYVSTPHIRGQDQVNSELFRSQVAALIPYKLPLVCANPDLVAQEGNPPRAVVRQGSIAALYAELGGEVHYIGKPSIVAFQAAMDAFIERKVAQVENILMVGDTPETDVRGARQFGMATALVMETGITAEKISHQGVEATLQQLASTDIPDFYLKSLAL